MRQRRDEPGTFSESTRGAAASNRCGRCGRCGFGPLHTAQVSWQTVQKRRLGVMGGTFDPIHNGHLVAASEVADLFDLDEVVFVPTGQPWLKGRQVSAGEDRYLMTVVATAANPRFSVSRVDIDRGGPTYTKDTLRDLHTLNPDSELYFITGADALASILSWQDLDELFAAARFVGVGRNPGAGHLVHRLPATRRGRPAAVVPDARRRGAVHLQARPLPQTPGGGVTAATEAIDMATVAARAAASKLADDVVVIDVSDQLVITDCFVIASASNERQVNAIVDEVEEKMREAGYKPARREGTREGRWTLLDYRDIVVHIQHQDDRNFYALDRLWGDCPVVPVNAPDGPASAQ